MPEPRIEQLFLIPGKTKADVAVWGAAVAEYAAAFPGVYISNDYRLALQPNFERITIVDSDDWHEEMWLFLGWGGGTSLRTDWSRRRGRPVPVVKERKRRESRVAQ